MAFTHTELNFRDVTKPIGEGAPVFIVAEIGINHNGDPGLARECIAAAAGAGADAVKFQNYRTEDFLLDKTLSYEYTRGNRRMRESQFNMFKRCELSFDDLRGLAEYAGGQRVIMFSTPTSVAGVDEILQLGFPIIKNASETLVHPFLVRAMAHTGLPCAMSLGMAEEADIEAAVEVFQETGNEALILVVCTSRYPTPPDDLHLRRLASLQSRFGYPVGFSDHSEGVAAAAAAAGLGACYIEKHFTLDKTLAGPDHMFSANAHEFATLVKTVRDVERALGSDNLVPSPEETREHAAYALRACAARDLAPDHILREDDLAFYRSDRGIHAREWRQAVGKRLASPVAAGQPFTADVLGTPDPTP